MITPLMLVVVLGIMQLSLALWAHTVLIDAAAAAAHSAAAVGAQPQAAQDTVRTALATTLGADYAREVSVTRVPLRQVFTQLETTDSENAPADTEIVEVKVTAPLPLLGFSGPTQFSAVGHAMQETLQ